MKSTSNICQSCSMPVETGVYCQYCTDENGDLQSFEERFARMIQFIKRESPHIEQSEAEIQTLQFMAQMPAWKNHPKILNLLPK